MGTKEVGMALAVMALLCSFRPAARAQTAGATPTQGNSQSANEPDVAKPAGDAPETWAVHGQSTFVYQYHPGFASAYRGPQSLDPGSRGNETWDVTLYGGVRLWSGAELWINPEVDQGFGISNTLGVAGYTSGEAYKVGRSTPYVRLQRVFLRQTIGLGGEAQKVDPDLNQLGGSQSANRVVVTVGKFAATDVFDTNKYAHDARNDFLNWSVIDLGAFDYAADAWGYSYGASLELYAGRWAARTGLFALSRDPNSAALDTSGSQGQFIAELEHGHTLFGQDGKVKGLFYLSRGRIGAFDDAVRLAQATGTVPDTGAVRRYRNKLGGGVNVEQGLTEDVGVFLRAGLSQGNLQAYDFTDISRSVSVGMSVAGKRWGRPDDTVGLAFVVNGISRAGRDYLNAGGRGILVGDGRLPNAGPEQVVEAYYSLALLKFAKVTADYQLVNHPAYNRDRGPVSVLAARLHAQF